MERNSTYIVVASFLVVILGIGFFSLTKTAVAATCPPGTEYLYPIPVGSSGIGAFCYPTNTTVFNEIVYDLELACEAAWRVENTFWSGSTNTHQTLTFATNETYPGGYGSFQFEMTTFDFFGNPSYDYPAVAINSFSQNGSLLQSVMVDSYDYFFGGGGANATAAGVVRDYHDTGLAWTLFWVYMPMETNGYVTVKIMEPDALSTDSYFVGGVKSWRHNAIILHPCFDYNILSPTATSTMTASPSWTPGGPSATPTHTPDPAHTATPSLTPTLAPYPTATGGTPVPQPTATAYTPIEVAGPGTPTPIGISTIGVPAFPTFVAPTLIGFGTSVAIGVDVTPNGEAVAMAATVERFTADTYIIVTRWAGIADNGAFSITSTMGISNAQQMAGEIAGSVAAPFSYLKAIQLYMPNLWPTIFFILVAIGWIMFNLIAKYVIAILSEILELVRKAIELIPFM